MSCSHAFSLVDGGESAFSVDISNITFGRGCLSEVGSHAAAHGCKRVALFTDRRIALLPYVETARASLIAAGADVVVYEHVEVEPTDGSFLEAARFASEGRFDGYVSLGGGSVIDTCKAASLYATYPAELLTYVNAPVGAGAPIPGPLPPHIACPTTSGTGSECTGIAVFDYRELRAKTGIASRRLRPVAALIDPALTVTMPSNVVAASGFDVLCHAMESFTAKPFTARKRPRSPTMRPMSQGANPWSDVGSLRALELCGEFLVRAVADAQDAEAREQMAWAATLAGIAFGNAGVHLPHGMSYAVAGLVRDYHPDGYPAGPLVPHGISVVVSAPAVARFTARANPERHLDVAKALGGDVRNVDPNDAGELLAKRLETLMQATHMPNGASGVGYGESDLDALTSGAIIQERLLGNSPRPVDRGELTQLFRDALSYW